jgi:prevent-host-death family protein
MKTIPSTEAKTNFGKLLDTAQREPVRVSKQGRSVAVMMSMQEYEEYESLKFERLRQDIRLGLDAIERGDLIDGEQVFNDLEKELTD